MLFGLLRRPEGTKSSTTVSLADAAQLALDAARRESLPLAHVAERDGRAQYWFAANILRIVAVRGRQPNKAQTETVAEAVRNTATLSEDMSALQVAGESEPRFVDLSVTGSELKKYLRWARSVQ